MAPSITFYDLTSALPGKAWSPNPWKTRYVLNYKGLEYRTEWLEYLEIKGVAEKLGAKATMTKPDGSPHYTLPMIHDASTGAVIIDSLAIAEYLDKTYPDTPPVIPTGTLGLITAFGDAVLPGIFGSLGPICLPKSATYLNPGPSREYYSNTRAQRFGAATIEELYPKGQHLTDKWNEAKITFSKIAAYYPADKTFVTGDSPIFPDFQVAAILLWIRNPFGRDSDEWKSVSSWDGGRWVKLVQALEKYEQTH